jgi:rhomboid family GlyGly-CTERM serine protease
VQGQPWRLLTGHLVHVDLRHAVGNAAALGVLWWLYGAHLERRQMAVGSLFIIVAVDIGLGLSREPQHWYVGGSGLLHGWMALGCFAGLRHKDPLAALGLAGLMGKLAWEGLDTPPPLAPGVAVAVVAHAWGTAGGLLGGIMAGRLARYTGAPDSQGRS